jgi:hypothetical protein
MSKKTPWIFVDCEARGTSAVHGVLTEFGAVHYDTRDTFHGRLFDATPDPANPAISIVGERIATDEDVAGSFAAWLREHLGNRRPVFVSDNPAYDWQWIAGMFDRAGMDNPFGHSGRRISDFWAGLNRDWSETQSWKQFRKTAHDHNPVHDAMGNVEAFEEIMRLAKAPEQPLSTVMEPGPTVSTEREYPPAALLPVRHRYCEGRLSRTRGFSAAMRSPSATLSSGSSQKNVRTQLL